MPIDSHHMHSKLHVLSVCDSYKQGIRKELTQPPCMGIRTRSLQRACKPGYSLHVQPVQCKGIGFVVGLCPTATMLPMLAQACPTINALLSSNLCSSKMSIQGVLQTLDPNCGMALHLFENPNTTHGGTLMYH